MDHIELCFSLCQRNAGAKAASNKQPAREGSPPAIRIGREPVKRMQGHPKVTRPANVNGEFRWRDPDDGERKLVDQDGLTDDRWIGGKAAPPVPIAQNNNIRVLAIVSWGKQATLLWSDSQNGEEIVGVGVALSQSSASVPADIHSVQSSSAKNPGKHGGLHAEPFNMWIAEPTVPVLGTVWRKCVCELHELLRLGTGSRRKTTAFSKLNMAVVAPMPSASVRIATAVKPGLFRSVRRPKRKSWVKFSMKLTPRASRHSSLARSMPPNSIRACLIASLCGTPPRTKSSAY